MLVDWDKTYIDKPTVVTIGVFDGVHRGHQSILSLLAERSFTLGLPGVVVTFDPHPLEVIKKERVELLLDLNDRLDLIDQFPHSYNVLINFNDRFAEKSPEDFVRELKDRLNMREIIIGYNFQFGKGRRGNTKFLQEISNKYCFKVSVVSPVDYEGAPISSSRIRTALKKGDIFSANEMLGRYFYIKGRVIRGKGLGKEIGFPTANIALPNRIIIPRLGVYATIGTVDNERIVGVTNIGFAPSVKGGKEVTIETHFLDFNKDIYDKLIKIELVAYIRQEIKFSSLEQLVNQINIDIESARNIIKIH
ncbi:MAG: bifunctional riboflavin kinase/FAD synthetase [bacterium]|nr:bifunctional riboflavin kinase/FAD synthetase [bacterium]